MTYEEFLAGKVDVAEETGIVVEPEAVNPALKPHQRDAVLWALKGGRRALFESFGLGKCHGKGTRILMHDCTVKNVEDVRVGDLLMGDDGTPRRVMSLAHGRDMMYRVTLKNGDSFTCNSAHILSFEMSNGHNGHKPDEVVNLPVTEYLKLPEYAQRNCYKAYKRGLDFQRRPIHFDPYVYGVWLGDGSRGRLDFTINDTDVEIVDYLNKWAEYNGLNCRVEVGRGCKTYSYSKGTANNQRYFERDFVTDSWHGGKVISKDYLQNSREVRLAVLAGLLDTDGYLIDNCYEIATKYETLRDGILFLCRSLGLSVRHGEKWVAGKRYFRIYISGNTGEIPCLTRKKAAARKQIKNPLRYGVTVEEIGEGEYFGFTLDGNHLYMLADFTVTHNTAQQLEWARILNERTGARVLIVCPLGVKQEFQIDAVRLLGWVEAPPYVRTDAEAAATDAQIVLTNYERVRDGDIDPKLFGGVSLDEASAIRYGGSKTNIEFNKLLKGIRYKLLCTATPSPNRYTELVHYSGMLEIMDAGQVLNRFFQRNSTKAHNATLFQDREKEFWLWVSSWALFIEKPSDLGYSDEGYVLPEMEVRWHKLAVDNTTAGADKHGQMKLIRDAAFSLQDAAKEKRDSIDDRVAKMVEIVGSDPEAHFILWHDLEAERHTIKKAIPEAVEVYGSQEYDIQEKRVIDFSDGKIRLLATKKSISGQGCNFQRHCHRAIFLGIDYEFNDFIQAIHRIYRFLQSDKVIIDIIYTESEEEIKKALLKKWEQHNEMTTQMTGIVKEYGLQNKRRFEEMRRTIGVKRVEVTGERYRAINNDCVEELARMDENSVDEIVTSIPFGNLFEYSPSYNDFGHNEDLDSFFKQMDFLTPNLLRVLKPGRVYACHVKDRILYGNVTGTGMPTLEPFHCHVIMHTMKHGFQLMGMITVVTDVVRENNQTYRLGWTECCKDGTKMGVGCPEYILLFRKLPTNTSKAYADEPVTKTKEDYTRAQWQLDAHAYWRSSGNRQLTPDELKALPMDQVQRVFREHGMDSLYNYEAHVKIAEALDNAGKLSSTHMTLPPASWADDVWDDINRMRTFNTTQSQRRKTMHVCPLQIDIVDRLINRYSNPGDVVLDPFGGIMTVPTRAVALGRYGIGVELNSDYFRDGLGYLQAEEDKVGAPTLFDFIGENGGEIDGEQLKIV